MQPASSTAFLELRRAIKRDRLIHQSLLEGRAADLGIAPSGCQHCGVRHSGHPHLFCFSSKDVDKAFVQAAGRGDLRIVQALLARRTLAEIHRISQAKAKKDKKWTDRLTHVNVRARPRFHRTPTALHRACAHGHDNVVSALLNIKASVGSRSARFATPLHVVPLLTALLCFSEQVLTSMTSITPSVMLWQQYKQEYIAQIQVNECASLGCAPVEEPARGTNKDDTFPRRKKDTSMAGPFTSRGGACAERWRSDGTGPQQSLSKI